MKFIPTALAGAWVIEPEPIADERGMFARTYCAETFARYGLPTHFPQCNISWNARRGTLRGMHYQIDPHPEAKLVRCTRGRVFDVAIDLRPDSPSFRRWFGTILDSNRRNALYVPAHCAHGFLTLLDDCEVFYQMSEAYVQELARGVRWNDVAFGIEWPELPKVISSRDAIYPDFPS